MKTRSVHTVTSSDEHVRLKVYDGDLTPEGAGKELLQLAVKTADRADAQAKENHRLISALEEHFRDLRTPWPLRWWRRLMLWIKRRRRYTPTGVTR